MLRQKIQNHPKSEKLFAEMLEEPVIFTKDGVQFLIYGDSLDQNETDRDFQNQSESMFLHPNNITMVNNMNGKKSTKNDTEEELMNTEDTMDHIHQDSHLKYPIWPFQKNQKTKKYLQLNQCLSKQKEIFDVLKGPKQINQQSQQPFKEITNLVKKDEKFIENSDTDLIKQLEDEQSSKNQPDQEQQENINQETNRQEMTCNCVKSKCQKKYCECFIRKMPCGKSCKCIDCQNKPENWIKLITLNNEIINKKSDGLKGSQIDQESMTNTSYSSSELLFHPPKKSEYKKMVFTGNFMDNYLKLEQIQFQIFQNENKLIEFQNKKQKKKIKLNKRIHKQKNKKDKYQMSEGDDDDSMFSIMDSNNIKKNE